MDTRTGSFRITYGCLVGRPPLEVAVATKKWEAFSVAFWMPSGHFISKDLMTQRIGHVDTSGEPPGSYPVIAGRIERSGEAEGPGPVVMFGNVATPTGGSEYSRSGPFLLARNHAIWATGLDYYFSRHFVTERHGFESMLISCFDVTVSPDRPLCSGPVQDDAKSRRYTLEVSRDHLNDAYAATNQLNKLLDAWEQKP